ncbi:roadblock/LC7 domain-containing protein [Catenulispora sp. NF23]|uniref:Roadblock/LC7 domain-containing protein n=1 Tax=Catenulispora pinistramenti TaxID=2705254 RepID=A0ABS5L2M6_9ACTN|nr:roadblock/LC7 domain-containing protein [Catenulispora pinistramenti]MBS2535698.1 roadblock/LC7 domain-containing protein [Catenulispora pinistramenti]MBS2552499.1 roadblock/LC7 domain-containing protein [Catenulispora pinistramenti]
MSTTAPPADGNNKLTWMLSSLDLEGVRYSVLISGDGLRMAHSETITRDAADAFAAAVSGVQSLGKALAGMCGDEDNRLRQNLIEYDQALVLVTAAGQNAMLGVCAEPTADAGLIVHRMNDLASRLGNELSSQTRRP